MYKDGEWSGKNQIYFEYAELEFQYTLNIPLGSALSYNIAYKSCKVFTIISQ